MEKKNNLKIDLGKLDWHKNLWNLVGMGLGVLCIIFGLVFLGARNYVYYKSITFGADFYTEIHAAVANAVIAARKIYDKLCFAAGAFFLMFGGIDICFFGSRLVLKKKEAPTDEAAGAPEQDGPSGEEPTEEV